MESLAEFLGSDIGEIMPEEGLAVAGPRPWLQRSGRKVALVIEGLAVLEAELSPADALLLWAISFPVLNQKFPSPSRLGAGKVAMFLHQHVLGQKHCQSLPVAVQARVARLVAQDL